MFLIFTVSGVVLALILRDFAPGSSISLNLARVLLTGKVLRISQPTEDHPRLYSLVAESLRVQHRHGCGHVSRWKTNVIMTSKNVIVIDFAFAGSLQQEPS